jgi:glycosyltransferase involved in cell wall biosynthesis
MRRFATISPRAADAFCTANRVPREKMRVIGYGVDLEAIDRVDNETVARARKEFGARPGELVFGSLGRLVEQKDYPTQLRALALVGKRAPIRMVIAGAGNLADELRALARSLGVEDRVTWLGERRDIAALLRTFDAFVLASKFEPYGVAILEAMAARLPIVATAVDELPTILDNGSAGILCPPAQPEALADALVRVANEPELATKIRSRARTLAISRYSLATMRASYQALYNDVLEEGREP